MSKIKTRDEVLPGFEKTMITEQEQKVLAAMRELNYGEVRVMIQKSEIVLIEEKKTIKL